MCEPTHFAVSYRINPWMDPPSWAQQDGALSIASKREWAELCRNLNGLGGSIELVPAAPGVPDLVFTANAAVVLNGIALLGRFRHPERQREEVHNWAAFEALRQKGMIDTVIRLPDDQVLEGAGDCVWDRKRNLFWTGYGMRSDLAAQNSVENCFGVEAVPLELTDPRFYHLDTALCVLPRGEIAYFPGALSATARASILERVPRSELIEIGIEDALRLSANAVGLQDTLIVAGCGVRLRATFEERGYQVLETPLESFLRSGGAAFCLTLRLDQRSG
jgi:N-dimethylarginine dimethylaminohydrolase